MFSFIRQSLLSVALGAVMVVPVAAQEFRLLMIEQAGCYYCRVFNRDIAPAYKLSDIGQEAPLFHADLRGPMPEGITLSSLPFVTPTFILIGREGQELERLTGFPGEDFFWPYIRDMIDNARGKVTN